MKRYSDSQSIMGPAGGALDITPSGDLLEQMTRFIMVETDGATITGELKDQAGVSHTTFPLKAGTIWPFQFIKITAVSSGTIKGYF